MTEQKPSLVAIIGPTAVGKTDLSFALAKEYKTELLSGDAYQVYRHMDIGTAKPTKEELQTYRHHLIDIREPNESFSAAAFKELAHTCIVKLNEEGKLPILVGGTGLYVQSLLEGYTFAQPQSDPKRRERIEKAYQAMTDEERADYIRPYVAEENLTTEWLHNRHRMIRLMENIELGTIEKKAKKEQEKDLAYHVAVIGLSLPREVLYDRINRRVDLMLEQGWIEETKALLEKGIDRNGQSMKAIGYRTIGQYLDNELTYTQMAEQIKKETRHFAKRQWTWYKRMPYVQWFEKERYHSEDELAQAVITYINHTLR